MRTHNANERNTGKGARVWHFAKAETKDSAGAWQDLTSVYGKDYYVGTQWGENVGQGIAAATVTLRRQQTVDEIIAPLIQLSTVNTRPGSNYLFRSGFDVLTPWASGSPTGTTVGGALAPDGSSTALVWGGAGRLYQETSAKPSGRYTFALSFKIVTGTPTVRLQLKDYVTDLVRADSGLVAATAGYQRVSVTGTTGRANTAGTGGFRVEILVAGGTVALAWSQVEPGSVMNAYVPTLATVVDTYAPLLDIGREIRTWVAVVKQGTEPTANPLLQSSNLGVAPWSGTAGSTMTGIGLDGVANTASVVTDVDAVNYQVTSQSITIPNDFATHMVRFWIKKDAISGRAPQPRITLAGGTNVGRSISLNTATGAWVGANLVGGGFHTSFDGALIGDPGWWIVDLAATNNGTGNTTLSATIYPAARAAYNTADDPTATGSVTVGNVSAFLNATATSSPSAVITGAAADSSWRELFMGRIDNVKFDDDPIIVECSDIGAWLMDTQIEAEGQYGGAVGVGVAAETVSQQIFNAWPSGKGIPTIYTPVSPAWQIETYTQARVKVLEAVRALINDQFGWDARFRYDAAHVNRFTIFNPNRTRSTVDAIFKQDEYIRLSRMQINLADVRNVGKAFYRNAAGALLSVTQSDAISISRVGRRYFELPENPQIKNATDAQKLIDAAVSDMATPPFEHEVEMLLFWPVQLYDRYTFEANGFHYDNDQTLAVTGFQHNVENGTGTTVMQLAGKITGGYAQWLKRFNLEGDDPLPSLEVSATPGPTTYTINYQGTAPVMLSIDGAASTTAPASPITGIARPAAGQPDKKYSFKVVTNTQTISDEISIPSIDKDTVTPDVSVTPGGYTSTSQDFVVAANAASGPAPSLFVTMRGTTATGSTSGAFVDGVEKPATSGETITVARPAFGTITQASITVRGTVVASERVYRTILNQVKTSFGPSFEVYAQNNPTNTIISYTVASGTLQLSINNAANSPAPASPITVTRPLPGQPSLDYTFTLTADGQTVGDSITVPARDSDARLGVELLSNPEFRDQGTGYQIYDNAAGGQISLVIAADSAAPNSSGLKLVVQLAAGVNQNVNASPGFGGFFVGLGVDNGTWQKNQYHRGAKIRVTVLANIPTSFVLQYTTNAFGTGSTIEALTSQISTGTGWQEYVFLVTAGTTGTFSSIGYIYITHPTNNTPGVFSWAIAKFSMVDENMTPIPADIPDLTVVPQAPSTTGQDFIVTAVNPTKGVAPEVYVLLKGTSGTKTGGGAVPDGTETLLTSGNTVSVSRQAFGTTAVASARFRAVLPGGGQETITYPVPNQVKTSFGPSLDVKSVVASSTQVTVTYSGTGTVEYAGNGGTYTTPPASPFNIARPSAGSNDTKVTFRATLDGQTTSTEINIPQQTTSSVPGTGYFTGVSQALFSNATDQIDFNWSWSGSTAYFEVFVRENGGGWGLVNTTGNGATTYRYTTSFDLNNNVTPAVAVEFYARAVTPGNGIYIAESDITGPVSYGHA